MKIFAFSPKENWILDRIVGEWNLNNEDICSSIPEKANILWFLDSSSWSRLPPSFLKDKIVVQSTHHIVPDKFNKSDFANRDEIVDHYLCPNKFTKEFIEKYTKKPISMIGYWYNSDLWNPATRDVSRGILGIPETDFVIGTFQRDTEGHDLISPKLEKGPDLFLQYIKRLDKRVHVLLAGWRRQYLIRELEQAGIKYSYKQMVDLGLLRKMYSACDLYIVSSRYEGGPQALLEASSMKIPIISSDVGMASEVLSEKCIVDIKKDIYYPTEEDIKYNYKNVQKYELKEHMKKYREFFTRIYSEKKSANNRD